MNKEPALASAISFESPFECKRHCSTMLAKEVVEMVVMQVCPSLAKVT